MGIRFCDDFPFALFSLSFVAKKENVEFSGQIHLKGPLVFGW